MRAKQGKREMETQKRDESKITLIMLRWRREKNKYIIALLDRAKQNVSFSFNAIICKEHSPIHTHTQTLQSSRAPSRTAHTNHIDVRM